MDTGDGWTGPMVSSESALAPRKTHRIRRFQTSVYAFGLLAAIGIFEKATGLTLAAHAPTATLIAFGLLFVHARIEARRRQDAADKERRARIAEESQLLDHKRLTEQIKKKKETVERYQAAELAALDTRRKEVENVVASCEAELAKIQALECIPAQAKAERVLRLNRLIAAGNQAKNMYASRRESVEKACTEALADITLMQIDLAVALAGENLCAALRSEENTAEEVLSLEELKGHLAIHSEYTDRETGILSPDSPLPCAPPHETNEG